MCLHGKDVTDILSVKCSWQNTMYSKTHIDMHSVICVEQKTGEDAATVKGVFFLRRVGGCIPEGLTLFFFFILSCLNFF
jgi:hypothetical protein